MLPFLGLVIGKNRPGNFLVRNKWRNIEKIKELAGVPTLLMSSLKVGFAEYWQNKNGIQGLCSEDWPNNTGFHILVSNRQEGTEVRVDVKLANQMRQEKSAGSLDW